MEEQPTRRINWKHALVACLVLLALVGSMALFWSDSFEGLLPSKPEASTAQLDQIPEYDGQPYSTVNNNEPMFTSDELKRNTFEEYSELDSLGRCGTAFALVGVETMPTSEREDIGSVTPSRWRICRYDDLIEDRYLYNRCHIIGFQLTGENANPLNLFTGTRYLNVSGMLPFENEVASYVRTTRNHVLYRVTPVFVGNELVARGVHMEAESVEDNGKGISFNVFVHNIQPGVEIDYATGGSWRGDDADEVAAELAAQLSAEQAAYTSETEPDTTPETTVKTVDMSEFDYVVNTGSMRFHLPSCESVAEMAEKNREGFNGTRDELLEQGYEPCNRCNP